MGYSNHMKCPNDQTTLVIAERQNIEIDYCPECRGVWLDRGELDKMINHTPEQVRPPEQQYEPQRHSSYDSDHRQSYGDNRHHHKKKRKESFLGDLFDF